MIPNNHFDDTRVFFTRTYEFISFTNSTRKLDCKLKLWSKRNNNLIWIRQCEKCVFFSFPLLLWYVDTKNSFNFFGNVFLFITFYSLNANVNTRLFELIRISLLWRMYVTFTTVNYSFYVASSSSFALNVTMMINIYIILSRYMRNTPVFWNSESEVCNESCVCVLQIVSLFFFIINTNIWICR